MRRFVAPAIALALLALSSAAAAADDESPEKAQARMLLSQGNPRCERKVGRIGIKAWPQRTALEIDGRAARDPTYVKPGAHAVKVRAAAGLQLDRDVDVAAGESVELAVPEGAHLTAAEPRDGESRRV